MRKREARNDFWAYCLYHDPKFFAKRLFLKKVADAFTRVYESYLSGVIRRLAVSMPPRAGKSYISSLFISSFQFVVNRQVYPAALSGKPRLRRVIL